MRLRRLPLDDHLRDRAREEHQAVVAEQVRSRTARRTGRPTVRAGARASARIAGRSGQRRARRDEPREAGERDERRRRRARSRGGSPRARRAAAARNVAPARVSGRPVRRARGRSRRAAARAPGRAAARTTARRACVKIATISVLRADAPRLRAKATPSAERDRHQSDVEQHGEPKPAEPVRPVEDDLREPLLVGPRAAERDRRSAPRVTAARGGRSRARRPASSSCRPRAIAARRRGGPSPSSATSTTSRLLSARNSSSLGEMTERRTGTGSARAVITPASNSVACWRVASRGRRRAVSPTQCGGRALVRNGRSSVVTDPRASRILRR